MTTEARPPGDVFHIDRHHCITCSDEGVELTVLQVDEDRELALCSDPAGAHSSVEIALIDDVQVRDTLLVHAGTALLRVPVTATATAKATA